MDKKIVILVIASIVIIGFLALQATFNSSALVLMPSEIIAKNETELLRLRVAGRVSKDEISYEIEPKFNLKFSIQDPGSEKQKQSLAVEYNGIRPDMFAVGRDVIIDGDFKNGTLYASKLLTQCPSKYEPPEPDNLDYSK